MVEPYLSAVLPDQAIWKDKYRNAKGKKSQMDRSINQARAETENDMSRGLRGVTSGALRGEQICGVHLRRHIIAQPTPPCMPTVNCSKIWLCTCSKFPTNPPQPVTIGLTRPTCPDESLSN